MVVKPKQEGTSSPPATLPRKQQEVATLLTATWKCFVVSSQLIFVSGAWSLPSQISVTVSHHFLAATHLRHQELGEPFGQPALLTGQNHLQHVTVQLLHDDKHLLGCLEHALQVDDARVVEVLQGKKTNNNNVEHLPCW